MGRPNSKVRIVFFTAMRAPASTLRRPATSQISHWHLAAGLLVSGSQPPWFRRGRTYTLLERARGL
jgi:hypothetical protein